MLGQAAQATISYPKLPQGNSCFPDVRQHYVNLQSDQTDYFGEPIFTLYFTVF